MKAYLQRHLTMGKYFDTETDAASYQNRSGWEDFCVGDGMIFSHRTSDYTEENFPEHLHSHDYCELLFWLSGDVQYLCGDRSVTPSEGCALLIPSGKSHTARLLRACRYDRFVMYFKPAAFDFCGRNTSLLNTIFPENESVCFSLSPQSRDEIRTKLCHIEEILKSKSADAQLVAYAEITLLLHTLKTEKSSLQLGGEVLPAQVRELRNFLDENYTTLSSVEEIAARFFYSREYVTRIFGQYFNLSPWKYIEQLRIKEACRRIDEGEKVTAVCYEVGYHSMSAFSAAFRRMVGASPTEYRQSNFV